MLLSKVEAGQTKKEEKNEEAKNGNNFLSKSKGAIMFAILEIIGFLLFLVFVGVFLREH